MATTFKVKYLSGAEAIRQKIITEDQWRLALKYPWTWVVLSNGTRIREIPWNGLEINETQHEAEGTA